MSAGQLTSILKLLYTNSVLSTARRSSTSSMSALAILLLGSGMEPCRFALPCSLRSSLRCSGICTTWLKTTQSEKGTCVRKENRSVAMA